VKISAYGRTPAGQVKNFDCPRRSPLRPGTLGRAAACVRGVSSSNFVTCRNSGYGCLGPRRENSQSAGSARAVKSLSSAPQQVARRSIAVRPAVRRPIVAEILHGAARSSCSLRIWLWSAFATCCGTKSGRCYCRQDWSSVPSRPTRDGEQKARFVSFSRMMATMSHELRRAALRGITLANEWAAKAQALKS
jgi:hypothetical protein